MRRSRRVVAACALGVVLLVPAIPLAAQEADPPAADAGVAPSLTPSNVRPDAALTSSQQDGKVVFDASGSTDSDGQVATYEWDLDGDSEYETRTGAQPRAVEDYPGGTTLIAAVRVTDDAGASDDATAAVVVAPEPEEPAPAPAPVTSEAPVLVPSGELDSEADDAEPRPATKKSDDDEPQVVAAATRSGTIRDFEYAPATINISRGDTVRWTNSGPTAHTVTANDGSFDSGNMDRGDTYSRTFSATGTFRFFCEPHPFMTGRVVVGSGSGGGSDSGGGSGGGSDSGSGSDDAAAAGADSGSSSSSDGGSLASTGVQLIPWTLFGFSLLAFGAALRFRLTE